MADVVVTELMDEAAVADLAADFDVIFDPTLVERRNDLLAEVASCRGLIVRNRTEVDVELIEAAPALRVVGRLGVGLDNIDVTACRERGIAVFPATGANAIAVAEYVLGAMLVLVRGVFDATDRVQRGDWPRTELLGGELAGRRLGLIGFGTIAREVARRALAFDMEVVAADPFVPVDDPAWEMVDRVELAELLGASHVVSIHVPLVDDTRRLIDATTIEGMRAGSILVNTSRGGIVDEEAVVAALRRGHLGGAALDVFETEPVDPATGALFADTPNLLLTPHVAGVTVESNRAVSRVTAANVRAALTGS